MQPKPIKKRFCTKRFMLLIEKANRLFGMCETVPESVTFSSTGATLYSNGKVFVTHEQYNDEEKEAYKVNGNRIFTLSFKQVAGCFWEAK